MNYPAGAVFPYCSFLSEAFVLGEISFLILLSSLWTSDNFSLLNLKTCIFTEDYYRKNIPNRLTNRKLFPILLLIFNCLANEIR